MANLQKEFVKFHETIKLNDRDENAKLREKRDNILEALNDGLNRLFEDKEDSRPRFAPFNQGSYAMGTGIQPLKGNDYDIDVGLRFHVDKDEYGPLDVKGWVHEALKNHTQDVQIRRCCVTVNYVGSYHVDLAVYASANSNGGQNYLAKGFKGSSDENKGWEESDAVEFIDLIKSHLPDAKGRQFRRIVRYLKRWKDYRFRSNGNEAPVGIGLTICAYNWFSPVVSYPFDGPKARDLEALRNLVQKMGQQFRRQWHESEEEYGDRLQAIMPVAPRDDVFDRMSNKQMSKLKRRLDELQKALDDAIAEPDPHDAAKILRQHFGKDFPVPNREDSAKKSSRPAFAPSQSSA